MPFKLPLTLLIVSPPLCCTINPLTSHSITNSQLILILRLLVPLVFHIYAFIIPINSNTGHWSVLFFITIHTTKVICVLTFIQAGCIFLAIWFLMKIIFHSRICHLLSLILFLRPLPYQFIYSFTCLSFPHPLLLLALVLVPLLLPLPLFPLFHTLCLYLFHLLLPFLLAWTYMYLVWIQIYLLLLTLTIFIIWWPKASIYKPKLLLSVSTKLSLSLLPFSKLLKILHGSRPWNWNLFPLSTTRPSILFLHFPQAR